MTRWNIYVLNYFKDKKNVFPIIYQKEYQKQEAHIINYVILPWTMVNDSHFRID